MYPAISVDVEALQCRFTRWTGAAWIATVYETFEVWPPHPLTEAVNTYDPAVVGVPDRLSVCVLLVDVNATPGGKVPVTVHTYGVQPLFAVIEAE